MGTRENLYDQVNGLRTLLNEWDFIGVYDPETNTDEYDCMISPLLVRLARGDDAASIGAYLRQEITGHFGMSAVSLAYVRPDAFAAQLVAWWNELSQTSNEDS